MRQQKLKSILVVIAAMLVIPLILLAGSTGKIEGIVTDKATGKPIAGASVQIVGTTMGVMTDVDGKFNIVNLKPGKYDLRITSASYQTIEVSAISVTADNTTEQNIKMEKSITDLDKVIKVVANKDILNIKPTTCNIILSCDEIEAKPVQNVDKLLKQTAGVIIPKLILVSVVS